MSNVPDWARIVFITLGLLTLCDGVIHGAAYFVLSGKWKGDTPLEVVAILLFGGVVMALGIVLR